MSHNMYHSSQFKFIVTYYHIATHTPYSHRSDWKGPVMSNYPTHTVRDIYTLWYKLRLWPYDFEFNIIKTNHPNPTMSLSISHSLYIVSVFIIIILRWKTINTLPRSEVQDISIIWIYDDSSFFLFLFCILFFREFHFNSFDDLSYLLCETRT